MLWKRRLHCIRNRILCYGKGACIELETKFYALEKSLHCIRNRILCYGKGACIALETEFYAMEKELGLH